MSLLINWKIFLRELKTINPYVFFILGDFNAKNTNWWGNINDYQGIQIDQIVGGV